MRLLLDTHIWLWSVIAPAQLTPRVARELEADTNELWLSPVSTWEALMLMEKGRVVIEGSPDRWVADALRCTSAREA
ncbi:MAG: PIN domain nuclease, partial [Gemmatimonadetes bacterium]|nr:PIN domain nuclease [Gemmatimonadota bacterium]